MRPSWLVRGGVAFCTVSLLAGCGARLSKAQTDALNRSSGGGNSSAGVQSAGNGLLPGGPTSSQTLVGANPTNGSPGGVAGQTAAGPVRSGGQPGGANVVASSPPSASATSQGLAVSSAVCQGLANGPGVSASEVDVGQVTTLTGPVPGLFLGAQHGIVAFADYLNSVGGICGRKLVVKTADDNFDSSQNATATQSLANSVFAFVASFSGFDDGSASVLRSDGVPDVGEAISSQRFDLPNNFSPEPMPPGWNLAPYIYFKQRYPDAATHMAVLTENASAATQEESWELAGLQSIGYKFVYNESGVEPTQTNFDAEARAMKAAGAQGVVWQATPPFYADLAKSIQNVGVQPFPLGDYGGNAYDAQFVADAGTAANGAIFEEELAMYQGEDAASVPMVGLFDKWYEALYHTTPDEFAAWAWLSGLLFVDGLNSGGGITRSALLAGLGKVTNFDGGGLVATDNPGGKKPPTCYLIIDVVNGKFVRDPIDPPTGFSCAYAPNFYYYNG